MIATIQAAHRQAEIQFWAEDEARLGLQPILRRVWTPRGERPIAPVAPKYQWLYVYNFVHPRSGQTEWILMPTVNTAVMNLVLVEFARLRRSRPRQADRAVVGPSRLAPRQRPRRAGQSARGSAAGLYAGVAAGRTAVAVAQ